MNVTVVEKPELIYSNNLNMHSALALDALKDLWATDANVILQALKTLSDLCRHDVKMLTEIGRMGGPLSIVKAMETHKKDAELQVAACKALSYLASWGGREEDFVRGLIVDVGGVEAVVKAMEGMTNDATMQVWGCCLLDSLTFRHTKNQEHVAIGANGILALSTAMRIHPKDVGIQFFACCALYNLADYNQEVKNTIVRAGGLSMVEKAATGHSDNTDAKWATRQVLTKLSP